MVDVFLLLEEVVTPRRFFHLASISQPCQLHHSLSFLNWSLTPGQSNLQSILLLFPIMLEPRFVVLSEQLERQREGNLNRTRMLTAQPCCLLCQLMGAGCLLCKPTTTPANNSLTNYKQQSTTTIVPFLFFSFLFFCLTMLKSLHFLKQSNKQSEKHVFIFSLQSS